MNKLYYIFKAACFLSFGLDAASSNRQKLLVVVIAKKKHTIPFTDETIVKTVKSVICDLEGICENEQEFFVSMRIFKRGLPKLKHVRLENNKTCADYKLKNKSIIKCFLKPRRHSQ